MSCSAGRPMKIVVLFAVCLTGACLPARRPSPADDLEALAAASEMVEPGE